MIGTGFAGAGRPNGRQPGSTSTTRTRLGGGAGVAAAVGLAAAGHDARHTVLVVVTSLGFVAAGVGFLVRWRLTSTAATRQVGVALLLMGLHQPVAVAVAALLHGRAPEVATAAGLGVVIVAAAVAGRAFPCRGLPPVWRPSRRAGAVLAVAVTAGFTAAAALSLPSAAPGSALLAGAAWLAVAGAAWRSEPLVACERAPARALAGLAVLVGAATCARALVGPVPAADHLVRDGLGVCLAAAAVLACRTALRRLTDAVVGQERYVAGLLEQLTAHERQLQEARACLHDARATTAGVRAASAAARHLEGTSGGAAMRADLADSVALELARLERMLRLPERTPTVRDVDLDEVIRPLVTSYRERGLRISWAPVEGPVVLADGDALAVILGNLLGNALTHAPRALCRVHVHVAGELMVVVADDGPGLSPAGRAAAFEAGTRRSGSPGEGLGLSIARDLARRHGGDLVAADVVAGTCFVLTLPVRPVGSAVPAPETAGARAGALR